MRPIIRMSTMVAAVQVSDCWRSQSWSTRLYRSYGLINPYSSSHPGIICLFGSQSWAGDHEGSRLSATTTEGRNEDR